VEDAFQPKYSKQYYAYIPFKPGLDGAKELESGVERWRNNVNSIVNINEFNKKQIATFIDSLEKENQKKFGDRDRGVVKELQQKIRNYEKTLEAGPLLHSGKSPMLLKHGVGKPLLVLDGKDTSSYVLYIVGHCAPGSTTIRETQSWSTSKDALTATQLIARMADDGLPKDILNVKLLCCFGARDNGTEQKAFSFSFWRELRGYCTKLVKMTAYSEAVLLTSFYKTDSSGEAHKAYAKVELGQVVSATPTSAGLLSSVAKKHEAIPCVICSKPALKKCSACKREFCIKHWDNHLDGQICRGV
jgi:hypothetical protein